MPKSWFESESLAFPAPRSALAAWLLAPARSIGAEGDAELRQTMMRRLDAILFSSAVTTIVAALAFTQHPTAPLAAWLSLDLLLAAVRIPVVLHMLHISGCAGPRGVPRPWVVDAFVFVGTLWSGLLGAGTLLCLSTNDPGLSVIVALLAMGTIGAQSARNPGSPRLNRVQMCLIMVPFTTGVAFSAIPLVWWVLFLTPIYFAGLLTITRQLHEDYVALLIARIENRDCALRCPLTGLANRARLSESLAVALTRSAADKQPLLMMCLDLDGFKAVNDKFGHAAGDALLVKVAGRLEAWSRAQSLVARLGGDEFAVLSPMGDVQQAETDAQTLIDCVARPYDLGFSREVRIAVSIGLAASAPGMESATIAEHADMALYAAKRAGKGVFRWGGNVALSRTRGTGQAVELAPPWMADRLASASDR